MIGISVINWRPFYLLYLTVFSPLVPGVFGAKLTNRLGLIQIDSEHVVLGSDEYEKHMKTLSFLFFTATPALSNCQRSPLHNLIQLHNELPRWQTAPYVCGHCMFVATPAFCQRSWSRKNLSGKHRVFPFMGASGKVMVPSSSFGMLQCGAPKIVKAGF